MGRWIPDVETEILAGAGHMMNAEDPELVEARILGFLAQWGNVRIR